MENTLKLPSEYEQLCKDIAKVIKDFNLKNGYPMNPENLVYSFNCKLSTNIPNISDIQLWWNNGRHGAEMNKIEINILCFIYKLSYKVNVFYSNNSFFYIKYYRII